MRRRAVVTGALRLGAGAAAVLALPAQAAEAAFADSGNVTVATGRLLVGQSRVVSGVLTIAPGAGVEIAAGAVLRVTGDLVAPAARVFFGAGSVDLSASRTLAARPEWWGAEADTLTDCEPALSAALAAHIAVALGPGDYRLGRSLRIAQTNRRLWGVGRTKDARGTRLLLDSARGAVVVLGTDIAPLAINDYARGIDLRFVELGRTHPPDDLATGSERAIGLRLAHVLDTNCEGLRANEHAIGYDLRGAVRSFLRDCTAFRSLPGPAPGPGSFTGFLLDGRDPPIATGANASLYIINCNANLGGAPLGDSVGCWLRGAMSDTFVTRFETTALARGVVIDGAGVGTSRTQLRGTQFDVHFETCVLDQCGDSGITIAGLGDDALLQLTDCYVGLAAAGRNALAITDCGGAITLIAGQFVTAPANRSATGIALSASSGFAASGVSLLGMARPVVARQTTTCTLDLAVGTVGEAWPAPAIDLTACRLAYLRLRLFGATGSYAGAVRLDDSSELVTVETAAIDPAMLSAPIVRAGRRPISRAGSAWRIGPSG